MIPVKEKPEPPDFDKKVRQPGLIFLKKFPKPTSQQFDAHKYWTRVSEEMRQIYHGLCAYSAMWIPLKVGNQSIDHFFPKSLYPERAYEWKNYRYVASCFNNLKRTENILDPFTLACHWFFIDFKDNFLHIIPNDQLSKTDLDQVLRTIKILKLNDNKSIESRYIWLKEYCSGEITFKHLLKKARFIAYELRRQDLKVKICQLLKSHDKKPEY